MKGEKISVLTRDPWDALQKFTEARIALGRCGSSLPLKESLKFKLAHAKARDAVHQPVQMEMVAEQLASQGIDTLQLVSSVKDREENLKRLEKGLCLGTDSKKVLRNQPKGYDLGVIISDGLSAPAIHQSAVGVACGFIEILKTTSLSVAPVSLVRYGRVAIGDEIGEILGVQLTVVLIGERPGLSSPNSLGAYLTYAPSPGITDESRNCISNIRPGGMVVAEAIRKIAYLSERALVQKMTGVGLKDKMIEGYFPMENLVVNRPGK